MKNLQEELKDIWITVDGGMADKLTNYDIQKIIKLCKEWALELVDTPCREGDGMPEDEIIEDTIMQAHVRQTIKQAIEESIK